MPVNKRFHTFRSHADKRRQWHFETIHSLPFQKKLKSVKKSAEDSSKDKDTGGGITGSAAESVITDEAFKLLQLVLRRAAATFRQIRCLSSWESISSVVISRVRDSLTKVFARAGND